MRRLSLKEKEFVRAEGALLESAENLADHIQQEARVDNFPKENWSEYDRDLVNDVKRFRSAKKALKKARK